MEDTSSYNYRVVKEVGHWQFLKCIFVDIVILLPGIKQGSVCCQILLRLSKLCIQEGSSGKKSRKQQQRLLRNMGAHSVVLELLQIPYEKVQGGFHNNKASQSENI